MRLCSELAYWIGLVQTDGFVKNYHYKNKNYVYIQFENTNFELVKEFRKHAGVLLDRKVKIFERKNKSYYESKIGVKRILKEFDSLGIVFSDPPTPPIWVINEKTYFGAYLAGVIDGDGDIRVKRRLYPQCVIRISSGHEQIDLKRSIEEILNCKVSIRFRERISNIGSRKISGKWFELEFYVSSRNLRFIENYILPFIKSEHKNKKINKFLEN